MNIKAKIEADFKQAYLNKNMFEKNFLSVVKAEVSRGEAGLRTFEDSDMIKLLKKMVDSAGIVNNEDSTKEKEILNRYLPKMLSEVELEKEIKELVTDGHMVSPDDKANVGKLTGFVIKELTKNFPGQFDAKVASNIIKTFI